MATRKFRVACGARIVLHLGRAAVAWTLLEGRDLAQGMVALPSGNSVALGKLVKSFVSSSVNEMLSLMP